MNRFAVIAVIAAILFAGQPALADCASPWRGETAVTGTDAPACLTITGFRSEFEDGIWEPRLEVVNDCEAVATVSCPDIWCGDAADGAFPQPGATFDIEPGGALMLTLRLDPVGQIAWAVDDASGTADYALIESEWAGCGEPPDDILGCRATPGSSRSTGWPPLLAGAGLLLLGALRRPRGDA